MHWEHRLWATGPPGNSLEIILKFDKSYSGFPGGASVKELTCWDFPGGPGVRLHAPNAGSLGLISGQGTRSHMLQLRVHMLQQKLQPSKLKKKKTHLLMQVIQRTLGSICGSWRSLGGSHGNLLQYSCPENPTDRGALSAIVHGVSKSWTRLSDTWRVLSAMHGG